MFTNLATQNLINALLHTTIRRNFG